MAERKKARKKRSVVRELGKAYASIPKEAGKAAKRYAKNTKQLVKDLPRYIKEDPSPLCKIAPSLIGSLYLI